MEAIRTVIYVDDLMLGGVERVLYYLCREMSSDEHEICLITLFGEGDYYPYFHDLPIRLENLALPNVGYIKGLMHTFKFLREFAPQNVICFREGSRALIPFWAKLAGVPNICLRWDNARKSRMKVRFLEWGQRFFVDKFSSCSDYVSHSLEKRGVKNVHSIENGVPEFERNEKKLDTTKLISIGNLKKCKNHSDQLKMVKILRDKGIDVSLQIVGTGPLEEFLRKQIASLDLQEFVKLEGRKENISSYLETGGIFISTSVDEGFGLALVEAMSAGLESAVYPLPSFKEIDGGEGILHFSETSSPEALAAVVEGLIDKNGKEINQNAILRVRSQFNLSRMVESFEKILIS